MSRKITKTVAPHVAFLLEALDHAPKAAIAIGHDTETLHAIASSFGLISVVLDDLAPEGLAGQLAQVNVSEHEAPELPQIEATAAEMLVQLALAQGRIKAIAPSVADGGEGDAALSVDDAANAAVATPQATETPAAEPKASATAADAVGVVVPDELARQVWPQIAAGQVVLVPDYDEGEFNGWWPATVLSRSAKTATLKWVDFDDLPTFTKPVTQLAVTHPAYRS